MVRKNIKVFNVHLGYRHSTPCDALPAYARRTHRKQRTLLVSSSTTERRNEIEAIPAVTSLSKFESAVEAFERGGGRQEYMSKLLAIGLPADAIRWLAAYPGRTMLVQETD